jgi:hypothetical protein
MTAVDPLPTFVSLKGKDGPCPEAAIHGVCDDRLRWVMERGPSRSEHSLAPLRKKRALRTDREVDRSVDLDFLVVSELDRKAHLRKSAR